MERSRVDASGAELVHLVLHESDERRHDHGEAGKQQGGKLEAQRLPRTGGHDRDEIATLEQCEGRLSLAGAELAEAEAVVKGALEGLGLVSGAVGSAGCHAR
jgi:hypothetical protein